MSIIWKRVCCVALVLAALAGLGACGGTHEVPTMNEDAIRQALVGKTWTLRKIVARSYSDDPARTLKFNADGTVEGFGGCNAFTGTYTLSGDTIDFGPLASSHKSCGPGLDEQEYTYLTYLGRAVRLEIESEGSELILLTENQSEIHFTSGESSGFFW
ncbi:META domain-containing protein [Desulfovibrio sp. Huiquan2017]|uniref:META domain-containing protein n=1 Tax=Desulfovibrio sp. Huiquan2017 TaxID=2816861 RepID=UPI001A911F0F|nr:META domain-containing protein [Desulfovibrio sp. Huiquan2017]